MLTRVFLITRNSLIDWWAKPRCGCAASGLQRDHFAVLPDVNRGAVLARGFSGVLGRPAQAATNGAGEIFGNSAASLFLHDPLLYEIPV